ncbi:MAG TPA: pyridoxal phosphate-dependent aminotransferase [Cyclobacteriaceae bacterium]
MNRRNWLKRSTGASVFSLVAGPTLASDLTSDEIRKFNPRPLKNPVELHFNENPYGPSESVREVLTDSLDLGCRYPYGRFDELQSLLAKKEGVTEEHIVVVGGSAEGLKVTGITYAGNGGEILAGRPTYLAMLNYAETWGANIHWVDVDENKVYDVEEIEKRISDKTDLVFLCNPNNPTSTILPKDKLLDFVSSAAQKTVVFSDEAYYDFISEPDYPSMVEFVKKDERVIVSRTFSKVYGLAGLRIGYLIAKPEIANKIRERVVAFTNIFAIKAAIAALKDQSFYDFSVQKVNEGKQLMAQSMDELGLPYLRSHTNFMFFKTGMDIEKFNKLMLEKGVKVGRPFPPFNEWCRISTGTIDEVKLFNQTMKKVLV